MQIISQQKKSFKKTEAKSLALMLCAGFIVTGALH
jgi:hypothetical protein